MTAATYHMPAEWRPQKAIWLAWPHQKQDWPGKFAAILWVYVEIIRYIAASQRVKLIVRNQQMQDQATQMLEQGHCNLDNVQFYHIPTNRSWVRDSAPTFVRDQQGRKALLDWKFNGWAKYSNWRLDNKVPEEIAKQHNYERVEPKYKGRRVVLEGGAIDVNGSGLLMATKECLLDQQRQVRNPGLIHKDYLRILEQYIGIKEIIWIDKGIVGDDTHGHIDDVARFVDEYRVVAAVETDKSDDNYDILQANKCILEDYRTNEGKALEVVELPMPKPLYFSGERLPASYANFLICNNIVLVPTFNDVNDRVALNILAECFPTRDVIGIHAVDLVWGFGTLHCLSQQEC